MMIVKTCGHCEKNKVTHDFQDRTLGIFKRWFNCGSANCMCTVCGNKIKS